MISNWSYVVPTSEFKTKNELTHTLDELLPINSMIKLIDPVLTTCTVDGQFRPITLCCDAPNTELILYERIKEYFVLDKLDDLCYRGNEAYIRGDIQIAIDYYTFAINRIITTAEMIMSNRVQSRFVDKSLSPSPALL